MHPGVLPPEPVALQQGGEANPGQSDEVENLKPEVRAQIRDFRSQVNGQTTTVSRSLTWPAGRNSRSASGAKMSPSADHRINWAVTE